MHFDLPTLYSLAIGTLILGAGMTLWERQVRPRRSAELRSLAAGYAMLAIGCLIALGQSAWPGVSGAAISNLAIVSGYLLITDGIARLNGRQHRAGSIGLLVLLALGWAVVGRRWPVSMWDYISAFPIAVASGVAAWEVLRGDGLRRLRSHRIVLMLTGIHVVFYLVRAFLLPPLVQVYGPDLLALAGKITMYEGVLYSVGLPMGMLALIREEAHDRLLAASRTDYLTGIGNRQWFFEEGRRLISAIDAPRAPSRPLALLAFDLDHFKTINDDFGHATGDAVLKAFACIVQRALAPEAIFARMGGEEFAALLPDQDGPRASAIGQTIAQCLARMAIYDVDGRRVRATVSIGVAEWTPATQDLDHLLAEADRALYAAKALGRNRTELAFPPARSIVG